MTVPLLEISHLQLNLSTCKGERRILQDVSFNVFAGEIVGLVGESGCGKSLTASAILRLLPSHMKTSGQINFEEQNLLTLPKEQLKTILGTRLSLILQDPAQALNPVLSIGSQLIEGLRYHQKMARCEAHTKGIEWLNRVGIANAAERMRQYPHELSGGLKQRVLIAMALICQPALIIADEPTTALDVTVQAQIIDLLQTLQQEEKTSLLLITHDLGVVARCCQRILVMYAGQIVESGTVEHVLINPQHPYTQALLQSRKSLEHYSTQPLLNLEGHPPLLSQKFKGCSFVSRCAHAMQICSEKTPPTLPIAQGNVRCWLHHSERKNA